MHHPVIKPGAHPREVLEKCGGLYRCPKDPNGKRLGPLVSYTSTYMHAGVRRRFVGDDYADFSKIEQWMAILHDHVAVPLLDEIEARLGRHPYVFCAAPKGGNALASTLAEWAPDNDSRYVFPEKIKLESGVEGERLTRFVFDRHRIDPGDRVIIVDDVCNRFSTMLALTREIENAGGTVEGAACFLNRSMTVKARFQAEGLSIPVIALWNEPMPHYRQDDPQVRDDLVTLERNPKAVMDELVDIMREAKKAA